MQSNQKHSKSVLFFVFFTGEGSSPKVGNEVNTKQKGKQMKSSSAYEIKKNNSINIDQKQNYMSIKQKSCGSPLMLICYTTLQLYLT